MLTVRMFRSSAWSTDYKYPGCKREDGAANSTTIRCSSRNAIIRYFQTENLLIAAAGAGFGIALAVSLNLWMVSAFEMERLHTSYAFVGAIIVLLLGQAAALWPALRAASVPPALATR